MGGSDLGAAAKFKVRRGEPVVPARRGLVPEGRVHLPVDVSQRARHEAVVVRQAVQAGAPTVPGVGAVSLVARQPTQQVLLGILQEGHGYPPLLRPPGRRPRPTIGEAAHGGRQLADGHRGQQVRLRLRHVLQGPRDVAGHAQTLGYPPCHAWPEPVPRRLQSGLEVFVCRALHMVWEMSGGGVLRVAALVRMLMVVVVVVGEMLLMLTVAGRLEVAAHRRRFGR
ncbi:hypothetical protein EGW08_014670 [Elysia chlorotica]|uniref:Uncharacterized protein n=1 Tax=Elysia chlorotica TaxID=188477 RepID=A0A3S1B731_ELYCH|nr:hypothetical protein EGW08_014670 [Elysia chlorotica]